MSNYQCHATINANADIGGPGVSKENNCIERHMTEQDPRRRRNFRS